MSSRRILVSLLIIQLAILPVFEAGKSTQGTLASRAHPLYEDSSPLSKNLSNSVHSGNYSRNSPLHDGLLGKVRPIGTPVIGSDGGIFYPQVSSNHWWMFDFWDNSTSGLDKPPYMDGSFVAVTNTIVGLTPNDAILYLPLNVAYGTDASHCVWFQFDVQLTASGVVSWSIWDINCPATDLTRDYHVTGIQIPYIIGDSYHWALTTSGTNTVTFSINNTTTGSTWSKNTWVWPIPSTNLLALDTTFSPSSTIEGYTTESNLTSVPVFQTTVGKGVVSNRYYSNPSTIGGLPSGITTGRHLLDSGHWAWELSPAGTLVVEKISSGGDGTFQFTSAGGGWLPQDFSIFTLAGVGNLTFANLFPGTFSITESVLPGWSLTGSSCSTGTSSSFTVSTGTVTCVFRNHAVGTVVVRKVVTGGGDGLFNFTSSSASPGYKVLPSRFSIRTTGGSGNVTFTSVDANLGYSLSEVSSSGWALIGSGCTVGSPSSFLVSLGDNTTCTFDNENSTIPDVGVAGLRVSRSFAYNSVPSYPIVVNATVANLSGGRSQTLTVSLFYNSSQVGGPAGGQSVMLAAGVSRVVTFDWYANSTAIARYTVTVRVSSVSGETNLANNNVTLDHYFQVRKGGDVDGDGSVDISDLILVWQNQFLTSSSSPYDIDNDGAVDITDLIMVWAHQFT